MAQLHVSSISDVKIGAATVLAYGANLYEGGVSGHDVPHVDRDGVERPDQPYTLEGTFAAAELRHAAAQHILATSDLETAELVTFENGIVHGSDLASLCTRAHLDEAAAAFGVPVAGDVAVVIWDSHGVTQRAVSPVRLFPAGMERAPAVLLEHFRSRGEPRSAQLAAGAARVLAGMVVKTLTELAAIQAEDDAEDDAEIDE